MAIAKGKTPAEQMSDEELERVALAALERDLGKEGVARFLLKLAKGSGDYTNDRDRWLSGLTVDEILSGERRFK